jgi:hypothetical protein
LYAVLRVGSVANGWRGEQMTSTGTIGTHEVWLCAPIAWE